MTIEDAIACAKKFFGIKGNEVSAMCEVLLIEIERLQKERDIAIKMQHTPGRIAFGWNSKRMGYGYYLDGEWGGNTYEDAIVKAAETAVSKKENKQCNVADVK